MTESKPLPLQPWALELAKRWNSEAYSVFLLSGNIFDIFALQNEAGISYVPLKTFLCRRLFPDRKLLLFYDIGDGLTFGSKAMQKKFAEWLDIFDSVEGTAYSTKGAPREFAKLAPLLRRFFLQSGQDSANATLIIDFPEKIIPAAEDAGSTNDERTSLVALLKWATALEFRQHDVGIILVTETPAKLQSDLLQNPHVARIQIDLPDATERLRYLGSATYQKLIAGNPPLPGSLTVEDLALRSSGLNIIRLQNLVAEAVRNGVPISTEYVSRGKKVLIEEFCQGLVKFKDPKPGLTLDAVATHTAAKKKLRELAWLFKNNKHDVIEKGVLLPGRVGVGKSFLVDAFAGECGLPVMEMGDFRSKWVGDTERQQSRILMTIQALGPVIVVVDEADAVFGSRSGGGEDNGVSGRVFAAFAAHIGDSSLRGRELWIAMTSRPDLLTIDLKRQGRLGLCIPLFPAQNSAEVAELFGTVAKFKKLQISAEVAAKLQDLGGRPLTGSDADSIMTRAREIAVLKQRDNDLQAGDIAEAVGSFIDALDPDLLRLQELAAILACSDSRYLPASCKNADRAALTQEFNTLKRSLFR
jgi:SpoVK/Ycf46/Vps4 family AAA+-type ATPase